LKKGSQLSLASASSSGVSKTVQSVWVPLGWGTGSLPSGELGSLGGGRVVVPLGLVGTTEQSRTRTEGSELGLAGMEAEALTKRFWPSGTTQALAKLKASDLRVPSGMVQSLSALPSNMPARPMIWPWKVWGMRRPRLR